MMTRRQATLACAAAFTAFASETGRETVRLLRVPDGGLQPQAMLDDRGVLHLIYFSGDPAKGDVFYAQSANNGAAFSSPLRVNTQPGSAIALGTIRGAQLAIGKSGRVHVAWNGSSQAEPRGPVNADSGKSSEPMLYTRLNPAGTAFEPQRNLMLHSFGLDGGGSLAADPAGNVYVAWHGIGEHEARQPGREGEARRRVWLTRSNDDGGAFATEARAWAQPTGACGCCGMKIFAGRNGNVTALYRSATESVHRDIYLLRSNDRGMIFQGRLLHKWDINACPMSSMDIAENGNQTAAAWETGGQIYWIRLDRDGAPVGQPSAAPGEGKNRKHPRLAINQAGETLLAWTEGTGWQKGGAFAWQLFDRSGQPAFEPGTSPGIPAWSFTAVVANPDRTFSIVY